ncbi:MAG TPA: ABC transporter ATP-binding protein [Methylomusa anaerophila]|uniref:Daunorubicin/doxorubicin resistance ATP-binding protein DrrA n=1 Tax=Methylomusa anaerophila TaxID=1930071 RepID=A0A348AM70_9FIRM|nr:ABC transporter ATP-binding protein [Methylomusa anaerophila]BBB92168.1 daunorubicin/doxorubicin resistance ATP-binding protein DrrA [Methylomusa anaerophila]HML87818.1 ABC transporter ATP-binding protein [Methylomusa anaerophila]
MGYTEDFPEPCCGVRLAGLTKVYEQHKVVDDLSLTVTAGEVFGLLGPNGAGKTTVMKVIAGLVRPTNGLVLIFGFDTVFRSAAVKQLVGFVPQDNNLERELTVEEVLFIYGRLFAVPNLKQRVEKTLQEFSLAEIRHQKVGLLSGGTARRTLIARALLPQPRLLLLDEPTVGLDPDVRQEIWNIVRRLAGEGKTVVLTTHYMEEAEKLCHRVAMLRTGRLALLDTPEGIKERLGVTDSAAAALETVFIQLARKGGN